MQKKYQPIGIKMATSATKLGEYLRSRRLELGISQADIARRAGMAQSKYSALETGKLAARSLSNCLDELAIALQFEPSELQAFIPISMPKEPQTALGRLIHAQRERLGLSIQELACRSGMGLQHLSRLEFGDTETAIRYSTVRKLARELCLDTSVFSDFICEGGFKAKEAESSLGHAVRSRRKELGLSLADVARLLHTSSQFISQIELGTAKLIQTDALLVRLAAVLQIDPECLRGLRPRKRIRATKRVPIESDSLAAFVFNRRLELGLTQQKIAERMGVKGNTIYKIEAGKIRKPRGGVQFLRDLGCALECEIPQALIPPVREKKTPSVHDTGTRGRPQNHARGSMPRLEDMDRIKELAGIGPDEAARRGVQLLRRVLERRRDGFSFFFAKDGDLVELELLL